MSRATERRAAELALEQDRVQHERPNVPPVPAVSQRNAWESGCPGWRFQVHQVKDGVPNADGHIRCRWCWAWVHPPVACTATVHWLAPEARQCLCGQVHDAAQPAWRARRVE